MTPDCTRAQPEASRTENRKVWKTFFFWKQALHEKFRPRFSDSEPEFSILFPGRGTEIPNFGLQKIYSDPEHHLDRVVHPADVVSRYCGVQREDVSCGEESGGVMKQAN